MSIEFEVEATIAADPATVYTAWLGGDSHAAMTGAPARASDEVQGAFEAWDGYISGTNLELIVGERIVQAWRTQQFAEDEADSRIEITLEAQGEGTLLKIRHSGLPAHGMQYLKGWQDHYFKPMAAYFSQEPLAH